MKKQIFALLLAAMVISLTGCPNSETQDGIKEKENYVNTTDEDLNIECSDEERTESVEPSIPGSDGPSQPVENDPNQEPMDEETPTVPAAPDENSEDELNTSSQPPEESPDVITPEDEPYEFVEPDEEYVCDDPQEFPDYSSYDAKPVIYLYPEETAEITVKLDYNGTLTTTYPAYNDGWTVTAQPDGTITLGDREYYCLFWEGISNVNYSLDKGFCVKGEDTEKFLEDSLKKLGLTDKEANEFIIYWLPKMENNAYNIISFQEELYTDNAKLTVSPAPDTVIRVFMAWKGVDEFVEIEPQPIKEPERNGFTVIEWGGTEIK